MTTLDLSSIAAGLHQTYALDRDGTIHAFGRSNQGERTNLPTGMNWVQIAAANDGGAALHRDGHIQVFGDRYGQFLENPPRGNNFVKVVCGAYGGYGLTADGHIVGFGGSWIMMNVPTTGGFIDVVAGGGGGYALTADGHIVLIGSVDNGEGRTNRSTDLPTDGGYTQLAAGSKGGYALTATGRVVAFGNSDQNQRKDLPTSTERFTMLGSGRYMGIGIRPDGSIRMWGDDSEGERSGIPTLPAWIRWASIVGGYHHAVGLSSDGKLYVWGDTSDSQRQDFPTGAANARFGGYSRNVVDLSDGVEVYHGTTRVTQAEEIIYDGERIWPAARVVWPQSRIVKVGANPAGAFAGFIPGNAVQWDGTRWVNVTDPAPPNPYEWQYAAPPGKTDGYAYINGVWVDVVNDFPDAHAATKPTTAAVGQMWYGPSLADAWQWDGTQWVQIPTLNQP